MVKPSTTLSGQVRFATVTSRHFDLLVAGFCVVLVISNIAATRGFVIGSGDLSLGPIQVWPLVLDGGAVLFPLAYILGDVISEVYGVKATRRAVLAAFAASILASLVFLVVAALPVPDWSENHEAFSMVLGPVWQIVAASLVGFTAGQMTNAVVLVRMKERRARSARGAESGLVTRLVSSSFAGEVVDTLLFCALAASVIGIDTFGTFVNYFVVGVLFKVAVEVAVMPATVRVIAHIKSHEASY